MLYQSQEVKSYGQAEEYCLAHHEDICKRVSECIKARLGWSDLQLMRDILLILNTQGWEKLIKEKYHLEELLQLISRFKIPLDGAGADTEEIYKEFEEIMEYAVNFISLSTLDYSSVWWRLFHCPSRSEWSNALILIELLFSLPASNGKVERVFSTSNVIKVEKRSLLSNESLDDLLMINTDKVPLSKFNADSAIQLWWRDKTRRPNQTARKKYKKHSDCRKKKLQKEKKEVILLESDSDDNEVDTHSDTVYSNTDYDSPSCSENDDLLGEWDRLVDLY